MTSIIRFLFLILVPVFVSGCSGWVALYEIENSSHSIDRSLSDEQIQQAILDGAKAAGWRTKILSKESLLATYQIRNHTVHVEIVFTDSDYRFRYRGSDHMKMYCTNSDKDRNQKPKVSGQHRCPSGAAPLYIHGNFEDWVDDLDAAIKNSLASV